MVKSKKKRSNIVKNKRFLILGILIISLVIVEILYIKASYFSSYYYIGDYANYELVLRISSIIVPLVISAIILRDNKGKTFFKILNYVICSIVIYFMYVLVIVFLNVFIEIIFPTNRGEQWRDVWKPILYLYPESDMNISVKVEHSDMLLTTYPKYNDGWNMFVKKNGDMYDNDGKYYYALYWDELQLNKVDFSEGFYVEGYNAIEFLEDKLSIIGLSDRERNEFIMYWLPKLESNGKSLVYFELTKEIDSYNKLIINPKPDSILRVIMHIKKVDKKVNIQEEKLEHFDRKGFVAVEWGGVIH